MKKFTTIGAALILGSFGFSGYAAVPEPTVDQPSGPVIGMFPGTITMNWDNYKLSFVDEETQELVLPTLVNNEVFLDPWNNFNPIYATATISEDGEELIISTGNIAFFADGTLKISLPADSILIGEEGTNQDETLEYVLVPDDCTTQPAKGSYNFSVSSIQFKWEDEWNNIIFDIASTNPDAGNVQYGTLDPVSNGILNLKNVKSVTVKNGVATIDLGTTYATPGILKILIPEGYFNIQTELGTIPNPNPISLQYNIDAIRSYPTNFEQVGGPFTSFILYAEKSIDVIGNLSDIIVKDTYPEDFEDVSYLVDSYSQTSYSVDGVKYPAIEFNLAKPFYGSTVTINIPSGLLEVNGQQYDTAIEDLNYIYVLSPEITPAVGATKKLESVALFWRGSEVQTINSPNVDKPTLVYGNTTVDLSGIAKPGYAPYPIVGELGMEYDDRPALVIDFSSSPYTESGSYKIVIPEGYVYIEEYGLYNNEIVLDYYIGELSEPVVTPADGSVLYGWPKNATINWLDEEGITPASDSLVANLTFGETTRQIPADFNEVDGLIIDWANYSVDANYQTVPGEYTITVPAGLVVNADGVANGEMTLSYNLFAAAAYDEITPQPGDVYYSAEELSNVTVSFKEKLTAVENAPAIQVLLQSKDEDDQFGQGDDSGVMPLAAGDPVNNGVLDPSYVKVVDNTIVLDLSFLENGAWYIEIPAGYAQVNATTFTEKVEIYYTVGEYNNNGEVIGGLVNEAAYTTQNLPEYATVTWDYEALELTGNGTITVKTWNEATQEFESQDVAAADVKLVYAGAPVEGEDTPNPSADEDGEGADDETLNALDINLAPYLEGITGNVWVNIPENFVLVNGFGNLEYEFSFFISAVMEDAPDFNLEAETGMVYVTWPGYGAYVNYPYEQAAYVSDTEGETVELTFAEDGVDANVSNLMNGEEVNESIGIAVNLASLKLADGTYTLWIPLGYVVVINEDEAMVNSTAYWQFEVEDGAIVEGSTGINGIDNVKTVEGVYNLQGVKMSNDLNTLAPGLYIINGKKVLIRK
ncbi:MAG: hypothetical protein J1F67_11150 [Muribaculaceae bacterium]|nr:hypothetical protein [Muribaculaceae bacterium]